MGGVGDRRGTALQNKHGVACDHGAGTYSLQKMADLAVAASSDGSEYALLRSAIL
jgi:hypothetical protein